NIDDTVRQPMSSDNLRGTMVSGAGGGGGGGGHGTASGTVVGNADDIRGGGAAMGGTASGGTASPTMATMSRAPMSRTTVPGLGGGGTMMGGNVSDIQSAVVVLSKQESAYQGARLEYICHLISRGREPLCPINGIMTLTPFQMLRRGEEQCRQLAQAVQEDLW